MNTPKDLERHALIARLIDAMRAVDSWCGETHIQKSLYTFQALFAPTDHPKLEYILYRHGPYSFDLADDLALMEFLRAIEREPQPGYGPRYALTEGGRFLIDELGKGSEKYSERLGRVAELVSTKNVRQLEALTTLIFVATEPDECEKAPGEVERRLRVQELKPHLTEPELVAAQESFSELKKVARRLAA